MLLQWKIHKPNTVTCLSDNNVKHRLLYDPVNNDTICTKLCLVDIILITARQYFYKACSIYKFSHMISSHGNKTQWTKPACQTFSMLV